MSFKGLIFLSVILTLSPGLFAQVNFTLSASMTCPNTDAIAVADLDGDGDVDVFVACGVWNQGVANRVYLNQGDGTFVDSGQRMGNLNSFGVALADLDHDGDQDAFVANGAYSGGNPNKVWLNDGQGSFTDSGQNLGHNNTGSVALADLDGDGDLDAFACNHPIWQNNHNVGGGHCIWLNDGAGQFSGTDQSLGTAQSRAVCLGDIDADGDNDVLIANYIDFDSTFWLNDGTGRFVKDSQSMGTVESREAKLADLDHDGDLDAFVTHFNAESATQCPNKVWFNQGDGTFLDSGQRLGQLPTTGVALGDLDGDGDLDAYVINSVWQSPRPDEIWLNDGQGHFINTELDLGDQESVDVALADLDGDGDLDALVAQSGGLDVWRNDSTLALAVDYCSYIGGRQNEDGGTFLNLDGQGRAYVMLNTASNDCPVTTGAFDTTYNGGSRSGYGGDVFAGKLSETGDTLDYGTYMGGSGHEFHSYFSQADQWGQYVFGMTRSDNFPTTAGAYDRTFNSTPGSDDPDVYCFKLDPNTGDPVWSTYIGGCNWEGASAIALGSEGSVYILGVTNSPDFPTTPGCYDDTLSGDYESFLCRFDPNGALVYSTLLGMIDTFRFAQGSLAIDDQGCAWLLKSTDANNLPITLAALHDSYLGGDSDIYLAKYNAMGSELLYSTYLGGDGSDSGSIRFKETGEVVISGSTTSMDFPLTNSAFDTDYRSDGRSFYMELNTDANEVLLSTFTPGSFIGWWHDHLIFTQSVTSQTLPITQELMDVTFNSYRNVYISIVDRLTGRLFYGAYIGGARNDYCMNLLVATQW